MSVGYKSEFILDHFGNSFLDIPIDYAIEEKPLGTGGAIMYALKKAKGDNVLITNGDTYFPLDLGRFFAFHSDNNNRFSVALKRMKDFSRYGSVGCKGNTITSFNEKKFCHDGLINGGIYLANRQYFESLLLPEVFSLEKDFLEREAGSLIIKGLVFDELFIDIGLPEDYLRASSVLPEL
jgi:D-glycero-alpha-D-manno-heptose 1-phosphate guanylyltransferase